MTLYFASLAIWVCQELLRFLRLYNLNVIVVKTQMLRALMCCYIGRARALWCRVVSIKSIKNSSVGQKYRVYFYAEKSTSLSRFRGKKLITLLRELFYAEIMRHAHFEIRAIIRMCPFCRKLVSREELELSLMWAPTRGTSNIFDKSRILEFDLVFFRA